MRVFCGRCGEPGELLPGAACAACGYALEAPAEQSVPCPAHPDAPAIATCARCGRFLCEGCAAARDPARCAPCLAALRHPLEDAPFTLGGTLQTGFRLFGECAAEVGALAVLVGAPLGALTQVLAAHLGVLGGFGSLLSGLAEMIAVIGFYGLYDARLRRREMGAAEALSFGAQNWGKVFVARLLTGLLVAFSFLLLIVPGLVQWVTFCLAVPVALFEPGGEVVEACRRLTLGRRWPLAGLLLLSTLLVWLATAVPALALRAGLAQLPHALPLELAQGALLHTLSLAGQALSAAFLYAAYLGLRAAGPARE